MQSIERAGAHIAYEVRGEAGRTVIAQHGLLGNHTFLDFSGLADRLTASGLRVVLPVSIGHKPSACPSTPGRYALAERVADVLAVADAVGAPTFGFLGYSMGSWIGTGVLTAAPERVHAAAIGGWDLLDGVLTTGATREVTETMFPELLPALAAEPLFTSALVDHDPDALTRCLVALFDDLPLVEDLEATRVPLLFYCGVDDPYYPNMKAVAQRLGADVVDVPGDHIHAFADSGYAEPVCRFFARNIG